MAQLLLWKSEIEKEADRLKRELEALSKREVPPPTADKPREPPIEKPDPPDLEREKEIDRWIKAGWVDTFRAFEEGPDHYSWWSQRFGVREKNIGWRIDYVLASPSAMKFVQGAFIHPDTKGSDHCPVGVDLDPAIFG